MAANNSQFETSADGEQNLGTFSLSEIKDMLEASIISGQEYEMPYLILGRVGVGKTEFIEGFAKDNGLGFKSIRLANYTETDLVGLPKVVTAERKGNDSEFSPEEIAAGRNLIVKWINSDLLPSDLDPGFNEKGILFLDEITNCSKSVQAAAWQLLDAERGVGSYKLPEKWVVICAGNGPEDGGNCQGLTAALVTRCFALRVACDRNSWLTDYCAKKDEKTGRVPQVHTVVSSFVEQFPVWFWGGEGIGLDEIKKAYAFPNPRQWKKLSSLIYDVESKQSTHQAKSKLIQHFAMATIGKRGASVFMPYYALSDSMIDVKEIVEGRVKYTPDMLKSLDLKSQGATGAPPLSQLMYIQAGALITPLVENIPLAVQGDPGAYQKVIRVLEFLAAVDLIGTAGTADAVMFALKQLGRTPAAMSWVMFNMQFDAQTKKDAPAWYDYYQRNANIIDIMANNGN